MSDVTTRRKKRIVARLAALAIVAAFASSAMLAWVAFLPGSCSFAATTRVSSESSSAFLRRAGRIVRAPSGRRSSADAGSWRASRPSESAATSPRRVSSRPCAGRPPPPRTTEGRDRGWVGKRVSAEKTRGDRGRRRGIQGGGSGAAGGTRPTRGRSRDARGRRTFVLGAPMTPPPGWVEEPQM